MMIDSDGERQRQWLDRNHSIRLRSQVSRFHLARAGQKPRPGGDGQSSMSRLAFTLPALIVSACLLVATDAFVPPPVPALVGSATRHAADTCSSSSSLSSYLETLGGQPGNGVFSPKIRPGDKLPMATLHWGFNPPTYVALPMHCGPRNVIIVGVVGAFMEESNAIVQSYLQNTDALKSMGVEEVIVTTVNDGAVTGIWNQKMQTKGSLLTFLADPHAEFVDALGTRQNNDCKWEQQGMLGRSRPFVMYVEGCIVKHVEIGSADAASTMKSIERVKASEGQLVQ